MSDSKGSVSTSKTVSSRTKEPKDTAGKDVAKDQNSKPDIEPKSTAGASKGGAKPKKPTGKSTRRIDSDSDEDKSKKGASSSNSRKRKRSEMEKEDNRREKNVRIGNSTRWIPEYFTNKKIHQVPSATVDIPGYKGGVHCRSIGTQTECSRRCLRYKGLNLVPMNIGDWSRMPMASLDFIRPKATETNSRWIEPKEGDTQGKYRFKPGTLALAEIKHYMGSEASITRGPSPSESAFLIPHTIMKRVILEIGMDRLDDCRFESLAYKILYFAGEHYLTRIYQDALEVATHMKKTTVTDKEMLLARRMCEDYGTYNL